MPGREAAQNAQNTSKRCASRPRSTPQRAGGSRTCMRASKLGMSMDWMWISRGTGLTLGGNVNCAWLGTPSHSPTSFPSAMLAPSPTTLMGFSRSFEMARMRDTTTSSAGPPSEPSRCSSSTMNSEISEIAFCRRQRLDTRSQCSAVATIRLPFCRSFRSTCRATELSTTASLEPSITRNQRIAVHSTSACSTPAARQSAGPR